ncbi:uncharacterized protein LOC124898198 [Capsicum annuum]|uniref:uncharacterized protein LOC124898198 n=1 Tax=Capsicum annuum TaxID=4072 RepID=UPI001FB10440|nr:uncharacterized protein LOC124898198 [Capsicum annuum]
MTDYGKPMIVQNFIFDTNKKEVVVSQVYKDKATLQAVMHNYSIDHQFTTKVPRSNSSRSIVIVDGSQLKSIYIGTFVCASTLDGAGNILPLVYGVTDSENDASWTCFFEQLKKAYGQRPEMCIVSDRNENVRVKEYLELAGYDKWSRVYAPVHRGWTITSNIIRSINSALVIAREKPIYNFLEEVRKMFGQWNYTNRQNAYFTSTTLGMKFQEIIMNDTLSARVTVTPSTDYRYAINDKGKTFIICLENKKSHCGQFQYDEIPCLHVLAILNKKKFKLGPYYSEYYKPENVLKTYEIPVYPFSDVTDR